MTTITLRPYQEAAVKALEGAWAEGINRPVVVAATGAGKTTMFCELIGRHLPEMKRQGKRILILAHRDTLLEQAEARVKLQVPDAWTAIVKGARGEKTHRFADVVIASVQTLARKPRREAVDRIGMIIVDECHNAASKSYQTVLDHYGARDERATPTVGFTATLTRMNGGLPEIWQSVAYQIKIHRLIKDGYLVPPVAKCIEIPGLNLATTRVTAGDLNAGDIANALQDSDAFPAIADEWKAQAGDRPTIAFMPNVATAEMMVTAFRNAGATAEVITGKMGSEARRAVFDRYNSGETQVLVNCMVLTEGFDAPHTSCVIIGRPTLNGGLYIQCVGRGLRLSEGKTDCIVLDVAGASLKHSLAGVNDLETDCESSCDCNCLKCGCSDRCKCSIRKCGCKCVEQHEKGGRECPCIGTGECGCGCVEDECACGINPDCDCRGEGPQLVDKEVSADVLRNLVDVDILGTELAKSPYQWLTTQAGISFLTVGAKEQLFLLPAPDGSGYFQGLALGTTSTAEIRRLDNGALPAAEARERLEQYADESGYQWSNKRSSWRRKPASKQQLNVLGRLVKDFPADIKSGAASDAINIAKASRVLDERFGKYVTR